MSNPRADVDRTRVFDALADPTRRQIVEELARVQEASITDIARLFPISRQAVTRHLGVLEAAGVIAVETRGRERIVSLRPHTLQSATIWLDDVGRQWDDRLAALQRHLTESS